MKLTPAILNSDDLLQQWQDNACLHPFKHKIFDQYLGKWRELLLDCGGCENCLIKRSADWYTRLYLHAAAYDECYMVNLDYAPFDHKYAEMSDLEKKSFRHLKDAFWHWDNVNKYNRYCLSPCLVTYNHFQDYMKRLRKLCPTHNITYYIRCEYGSRYGRPHAHLIVFSDKPIGYEFQNAWSLFGRPIGHARVENLKLNGTLVPDKTNPKYNAKFCFRYVAKYLNKTQNYNSARLHFAYELFVKRNHDGFEKVTRKMVYEMRQMLIAKTVGNDLPTFDQFCRIFKPVNRCSTRQSIGCVYLQENMSRFLDGNLQISLPDGSSATCPAYFVRKINEQKFPFRIYERKPNGVSKIIPNHSSLLSTFDGRIETILRDYSTACRCDPAVSVGDLCPLVKNTYRTPSVREYRTFQHTSLYDTVRRCFVDIHFFDGDSTPYIAGVTRHGDVVYLIKYSDFEDWYRKCLDVMKLEHQHSDQTQSSLLRTYKQISLDKLNQMRDKALLRIENHKHIYNTLRDRCANLE